MIQAERVVSKSGVHTQGSLEINDGNASLLTRLVLIGWNDI